MADRISEAHVHEGLRYWRATTQFARQISIPAMKLSFCMRRLLLALIVPRVTGMIPARTCSGLVTGRVNRIAHVEYLRGVANPIGIKCGPSMPTDDLLRLLDILNPVNEAGRITLISRMGHEKVRNDVPPLVKAVEAEGRSVVWSCDPMHGNTVKSGTGFKTRPFDSILGEVRGSSA